MLAPTALRYDLALGNGRLCSRPRPRDAARPHRTAGHTESVHLDDLLRALDSGEIIPLFPPFRADFGRNLRIGRRVFVDSGCVFQGQGSISIGDDCLTGPHTVISTIDHDLAPGCRADVTAGAVKVGAPARVIRSGVRRPCRAARLTPSRRGSLLPRSADRVIRAREE